MCEPASEITTFGYEQREVVEPGRTGGGLRTPLDQHEQLSSADAKRDALLVGDSVSRPIASS